MVMPLLEDVFKTNGVPTYTFVEPKEYKHLLVNIRTPGRGLVVEGPSGIGKTTAIIAAIEELKIKKTVTMLSPRQPGDIEYIENLPNLGDIGIVIVDDFHKLPERTRAALADFMKTLADREAKGTKLIVAGINKAGHNLISFAHDLVNRVDVIRFESNPDDKVAELVDKGARVLNVTINVSEDIVGASHGGFYLAQMLAREVCIAANILEACETHTTTEVSFEGIKANVWDRLALSFKERCKRFCRGTKMKKEGRAPYLHILKWLAEGPEWTLSLRDAMRQNANMRGSVGQVVDKGYLKDLISGDTEITDVIHYDSEAQQITIDNPQFFFLRNISWKSFASEIGFVSVEFRNQYDFALSFAGEARSIAEAIFRGLQEEQVEVFYDKNEQHRILAEDVEDYLRPIYQSEARFVVALLSAQYPKKIWTKFESEQFKDRFSQGAVIPIWFSDAQPGVFDESRKYGGLEFDPSQPADKQIQEIINTLLAKLAS